jgi:cold shock CspA family protein
MPQNTTMTNFNKNINIDPSAQIHEYDPNTPLESSSFDTTLSWSPVLERQVGQVLWFQPKKGYGMVRDIHTKKDIFVHQSGIKTEMNVFRQLYPGEYVEYDEDTMIEQVSMSENKVKTIAVNVTGIKGNMVMCEYQLYANLNNQNMGSDVPRDYTPQHQNQHHYNVHPQGDAHTHTYATYIPPAVQQYQVMVPRQYKHMIPHEYVKKYSARNTNTQPSTTGAYGHSWYNIPQTPVQTQPQPQPQPHHLQYQNGNGNGHVHGHGHEQERVRPKYKKRQPYRPISN